MKAINDTEYPRETGTKILPVYTLLNKTAFNHSYGFRPDFANVGIVMTDGNANDGPRRIRNLKQ